MTAAKQPPLKNKNLYRFSLASGLLTLIVGIGIFTLWWIARAWFAYDLSSFEGYGFLWMLFSVPLALIALTTSIIVIATNSDKYLRKTFLPLIIIFLNIPAVYIVLELQSEISERVYFKLKNNSNQEITNLRITSASFNTELGSLGLNESLVDYYIPKYIGPSYESVPAIEELTLELTIDRKTFYQPIPYAMKGWCDRITITDSLTLK